MEYYIECGYDILEVYSDKLIIKRKKKMLNTLTGMRGDTTIHFTNITAIKNTPARGMRSGNIIFATPDHKFSSNPNYDDNGVTYTYNYNETAEQIANYINKRIQEINSQNRNRNNSHSGSSADEILKYKKLLDMGVITKAEFEKKKKQLLGI